MFILSHDFEIIRLPRILLGMCWDPDNKNAYIDHCYQGSRSPLDMIRFSFIEHYYSTSIDDNLHKELDLENPECEQYNRVWDTIVSTCQLAQLF